MGMLLAVIFIGIYIVGTWLSKKRETGDEKWVKADDRFKGTIKWLKKSLRVVVSVMVLGVIGLLLVFYMDTGVWGEALFGTVFFSIYVIMSSFISYVFWVPFSLLAHWIQETDQVGEWMKKNTEKGFYIVGTLIQIGLVIGLVQGAFILMAS